MESIFGTLIAAMVSVWTMDPTASTLEFVGRQGGEEFVGHFDTFDAQIQFDPQALDQSEVTVTIDMGSARAGAAQRDQALPTESWFHVAMFPQARFEAVSFAATEEPDVYDVTAELTIRDVTETVQLPVEIVIDGNTATASGELTVDRTAFNVGLGQFSSGDVVALDVVIRFDITATR